MQGTDIYAALQENIATQKCFSGVFPADKLPRKKTLWKFDAHDGDRYIIANTDPAHMPGQHWVAMCISKTHINEYFDSYGQFPDKIFQQYLDKNFLFLQDPLQTNLSTTCGQWCLYYILEKCNGGTFASMCEFLSPFTQPFEKDFLVQRVVKTFLDVSEPIIDVDFLLHQICTPMNI